MIRKHTNTFQLFLFGQNPVGRSLAGETIKADHVAKAFHQKNATLDLNHRKEDIGITCDDLYKYSNIRDFDYTLSGHYGVRQYNLKMKFKKNMTLLILHEG